MIQFAMICKHIPEYDQCCCSLYHSISIAVEAFQCNPPLHLAVLVPSSGSPKEFRQTKTIPIFRPARTFFRHQVRSQIDSPQNCGLTPNQPVETSNHPWPHSRLSFPSQICNIFLQTETSQLDKLRFLGNSPRSSLSIVHLLPEDRSYLQQTL